MPTQDRSEMFSHKDGKKTDAHLHEPILASVDESEHQVLTGSSKEHARKLGLNESQLEKLYNPKGEK